MTGQCKSGAQGGGRLYRLDAFVCIRAKLAVVGQQHIGIGLMVRSTDSSSQLMQLGQAELVGAMNDYGIRAGDVDACLNNSGADKDVVALVIEVGHDLLQVASLPSVHGQRRCEPVE